MVSEWSEAELKGLKSFIKNNYTGVQSNSKHIKNGNVFVAITGTALDGHCYIEDAIKRGAIAIVGEKEIKGLPVPYFKVSNARKALGNLAAMFYQYPSENHSIIAITGTNGKTTTSFLIKHILNFTGESCSLFGTVAHFVNGEKIRATNTTPDATILQKLLAESTDRFVVMEASSHGIDQHRLEGTSFDYALFTNLSQDHLDYHDDLESYFNVKAQLFHLLKKNGEANIGSYSPWGCKLKDQLLSENKTVFSFGEKDSDDVQILGIDRLDPSIFHIKDRQKKYTLFSPLPGVHNIWNTMQAYLAGRRLGIDPNEIINSLKTFQGVPGRFEQYKHPSEATFIVDYAHTPEALEYCLSTSKNVDKGKLVHIFGFRGKRDREKRSKMLQASIKYSDETIITLDDLNGEDVEEMSAQVYDLLKKYGNDRCKITFDRTKAIKRVWEEVKAGDIVLITGKGHEQYERTFTLPSTSDRDTIMYLGGHNRADHLFSGYSAST